MPRGQVLTIPNGTAVLVTTLSREEKASMALLNPNDGIVYVKLNGPALNSPTMWDWKIPSQSYCQLPGPWDSVGAYYLDQSGSGRTAEVNLYESDTQISIPSFIAIGRAVQQAGSTVDISQGNQPTNPPAGSSRLWVDGSGNLHLLSPTGSDRQMIDSTNYNTMITVTGDVIGPLNNTRIQLRNNSTALAIDSGGTTRNLLQLDSSNYVNVWNAGGQYWRVLNQSGSIDIGHTDNAGNWNLLGLTVSSLPFVLQQGISPAMAQGGILYWHNNQTVYTYLNYPTLIFHNSGIRVESSGSAAAFTVDTAGNGTFYGVLTGQSTIAQPLGQVHQWQDTNSKIWVNTDRTTYIDYWNNIIFRVTSNSNTQAVQIDANGRIINNGGVQINGNGATSGPCLWLEGSQQVKLFYDSSYGGVTIPYGNGTGSPYFRALSGLIGCNGNYTNGLESGYVQSNYASAMGSAWQVRSARGLKKAIEPLSDRDCFNYLFDRTLTPYRYEHIDETIDKKKHIGFMADEMHSVLPEFTAYVDGEPAGIDYAQITAMLWGAIRYVINHTEIRE